MVLFFFKPIISYTLEYIITRKPTFVHITAIIENGLPAILSRIVKTSSVLSKRRIADALTTMWTVLSASHFPHVI